MYDVPDRFSEKFRYNLILGVIVSCLSYNSHSQELKVNGGFVEDGMKLGQDVHYWISAHYPENIDLFLPDSTYDFAPFEYSNKTYYPSQISNGVVFDSVVYTLQSYEIDKVQYLDLPAFILKGNDTTLIKAGKDSILFFELVKEVSDTTKLKENLAYQKVPTQTNYPLIAIILVVILVLCVVGYLIFGKKIIKIIKLRRLRKDYVKFSGRLTEYIRSLKENPEWQIAEKAVSDWKSFLEKLDDRPYTKLTTKEITALDYTQELKETLKNIDRSVYGKIPNSNLYKEFQAVEDFTEHRYSVITDQIKNG